MRHISDRFGEREHDVTVSHISAQSGDLRLVFQARANSDAIVLSTGAQEIPVVLEDTRRCLRAAQVGDRQIRFGWRRRGDVIEIVLDGVVHEVTVADPRFEALQKVRPAAEKEGRVTVRAPIPGLVTTHRVQPGDKVTRNQSLLVLAAMKLENEIAAPRDGTVIEILAAVGKPVEKNDPLIVLE